MLHYIYTLLDTSLEWPFSVRYVGKTINPHRRLKAHIYEASYIDSYKNHWIKKMLDSGKNPVMEIICLCNKNTWKDWEKYWIAYFRNAGASLTNISEGGDGFEIGHVLSPQSIERMRSKKLGKKVSPETRRRMSEGQKKVHRTPPLSSIRKAQEACRGKHHSPEHKQKIANALRGTKRSEETKQKHSVAAKGKPWTRQKTEKQRVSHSGENNYAAKLTNDQARDVRRLFSEGHSIKGLMEQFKVDYFCVRCIVKGLTYKNI